MKRILFLISVVIMLVFAVLFISSAEAVKYGDTNRDGKVDIKDVVLFAQYLANWNVDIGMEEADCNKDEKVDIKDIVLIAQYLAGWKVELGTATETKNIVVDAVSYSKKISSEFDDSGITDTHHTVVLPKVNYDTDAAAALNKKIMKNHGDSIEILKSGKEDRTVYKISYSFSICNGIVGIMVSDSRSVVQSYRDQDYFGYYYDTKRDKELNYFEYLETLGVDYSDIVCEINKVVSTPLVEYSTNYKDYEITAVIFDENSFIAEVPSPTWGTYLVDIPVSIIGRSEKKYEVSEVLMKWYQKNKDKLDTNQRYGELSSIDFYDLDADGADEICFIYDDYATIYVFYKLENGIYDMDCRIGPGSGSGYFEAMRLCTGSDGIVSAYFSAIMYMDDALEYYFHELHFIDGEWVRNEESTMYLWETTTTPAVYKYSTKSTASEDYIEISKEEYKKILDSYFDGPYPLV